MDALLSLLNQQLALTPLQQQAFKALLIPRSVVKHAYLLQPGQQADTLYFIERGACRSYLLRDGEDITDYFFFEHSFATDFAAFYGQKPTPFFLQTMEDCELILLPRPALLDLYQQQPIFERLGRTMAEMAFVEIEARLRLLHQENLETRFRWMMQQFPEVFQRVAQYHIASYLGVKPESLSRIKRAIGKEH